MIRGHVRQKRWLNPDWIYKGALAFGPRISSQSEFVSTTAHVSQAKHNMWPGNQPLDTSCSDSLHLIYWIKYLVFQADSKTGNESGGRGFLWDPRRVFVLFSQKSKTRRFVFKSHWWEPKDRAKGIVKDRDKIVSGRWRRKCIFWVMEGGAIPQRRFQLAAWKCKLTCFMH